MKIEEFKSIVSDLKAASEVAAAEVGKPNSEKFLEIYTHIAGAFRNMESVFRELSYAAKKTEAGLYFYIFTDVKQCNILTRLNSSIKSVGFSDFRKAVGSEWVSPLHYDCNSDPYCVIFSIEK